jgi:sugar lactone lactonase YvrE
VPDLPPAQHGEGPTWDAERGELLWVDISAGQVRRAAVGTDGTLTETGVHRGGDTVGAVVPASDGGWLLAADGGFTHLATDGTARVLVALAGEGGSEASGGTRMNDAACDPAGRFLAGTMAFDERPGAGALYRLDLDGTVTTVLDGLTVSNGIDWSPDGRTVYLADSGPGVVHAFDHDPDTGAFTGGRVLLEFTGTTASPTGSPSTTRAASGRRCGAADRCAAGRRTASCSPWWRCPGWHRRRAAPSPGPGATCW